MPTQAIEPVQSPATSLFIGLQSYTEAQSAIFYGRDEEIDRLTNLVKTNTLTIVFGKSGTGKTSLLNAGVFPKLRKDYCLPFRIRLEFQEDSPDLVTQIKNILRSEIDKYGFKVEAYPATETLWEYFHSEQLWKSVTPILIFDQFEEIFTLAKKSPRFDSKELAAFWEELADVIENSIPEKLKEKFLNNKERIDYSYKSQKTKILFSFREEFLPEFESITSKIPSIKYSRFRLMPMNGNQAYEVITKTWKNNIDAAQANKIVSFFTKEDEVNKSYDLLEIEPSLLSQVCSYIDKERIIQGSDKISAEFLNKYPKEIILRSIYNEVLTESNDTINSNENELNKTGKPVNEFVEDKLITDEGYRTKYALIAQDEKLKPGIEVLKSKYFLRDDGKSIELTHDVLVPLIKNDREERRKRLALVAARKKANRRALFIILIALIAAVLIYFLTTRKARQDRKQALQETKILKAQLKKDSIKLESISESIIRNQARLDELKNSGKNNFTGDPNKPNSAYEDSLTVNQFDSIRLASLKSQYENLMNQKSLLQNSIDLQNAQIADLINNKKKLEEANNTAKRRIDNLQRKLSFDSGRLATLQKNYDDLRKKFNAYRIKHPELYTAEGRVIENAEDNILDTNSLKLKLYAGLTKKTPIKVPGNLKIYLIPDSSYNKKIIKAAKVYEIYCDELNLDKARGKKIAKYKDRTYSFYDVPPGKYFVKICGYYGGFYSYTKKSAGNDTVTWDGSPPIR